MTTRIEVRFVKENEISNVVLLCKQHALYERSSFNMENKTALLRKHIFSENPPLYCLVVLKEESLIGYATYMKQFSTWDARHYVYLDCIFIREESRGLGIGEELMYRIREETKKIDCNEIQWQTPDFNVRAIKFYKRIGAYPKTKERFFWN